MLGGGSEVLSGWKPCLEYRKAWFELVDLAGGEPVMWPCPREGAMDDGIGREGEEGARGKGVGMGMGMGMGRCETGMCVEHCHVRKEATEVNGDRPSSRMRDGE